jgi:hypothetical protein
MMQNSNLDHPDRTRPRRTFGRRSAVVACIAVACAAPTAAVLATTTSQPESIPTLVEQVRAATEEFRDVDAAIAAGYGSAGSCVSGPEEGAMGVHYANPALIGDGQLDAAHPEILIYELRGGHLRLVGVEYLVLADAWTAATPPVLVGQHFQFVNSPNRYGLGAFYELHVWAWKENRKGTFADWNPAVSCVEYTGEHAGAGH